MKLHESDAGLEADLERIRELLQAHAEAAKNLTARSDDGLVQVTVDQRLRVVSVEFLDKSIDPDRRPALQKSTAEAINTAMQRVILSSAEALMNLRATMGQREFEPGGSGDGGSGK